MTVSSTPAPILSEGTQSLIVKDSEHNSALKTYISNRLMHNDFPSDSRLAIVARRILQLSAIFVAGAAQGGMVNINMSASEGNDILGWALVASNLSSFGSFYAYCSWVVLNEAFKTLSEEEVALFKSDIPEPIRAALKVSAAAIGAFSQVPMAYAAYSANSNSLFYGIARFLDAGLPIRSLYLGAEALFSNSNLNQIESKLEKSRNALICLIKEKQSTLVLQTPEVRELLNNLNHIHSGSSEDYLRAIINLPTQLIQDSKIVSVAKKTMWGIGHLSNLVVMALYGVITYDAMSLITDNEGLKICAALVVIACKFYLWKDSVSHAARQFPTDLNRFLGNKTQKSIAHSFMPATDTVATSGAYAIGALTYGSMKYFCDLYKWGPAGTTTSSIATALLAKNTFTTLKNGFIEEGLVRWGSEDQKKLIKFSRELERFATTLKYTYRPEFAKFLLTLPLDLKQVIYKEGITEDEIDFYIQTKKSKSKLKIEELDNVADDPNTPINCARGPGYRAIE